MQRSRRFVIILWAAFLIVAMHCYVQSFDAERHWVARITHSAFAHAPSPKVRCLSAVDSMLQRPVTHSLPVVTMLARKFFSFAVLTGERPRGRRGCLFCPNLSNGTTFVHSTAVTAVRHQQVVVLILGSSFCCMHCMHSITEIVTMQYR
jgi:hypothetical protein